MFGLKRRDLTESNKNPADIFHKLIPGAAITLQVMLESFLSGTFGSEECSSKTEGIFRTIAFFMAWSVGLFYMNWEFRRDEKLSASKQRLQRIKHAFVNVGVVTSWVFAVSDFPLICWIGGQHGKSISTARGMLVILAQVIVSFELFEPKEEEGVTNEATVLNNQYSFV